MNAIRCSEQVVVIKKLSFPRKSLAMLAAAAVVVNPGHAISEMTMGYRSLNDPRGEDLTAEQQSSVAAADRNGDGFVGWREGVVELYQRWSK